MMPSSPGCDGRCVARTQGVRVSNEIRVRPRTQPRGVQRGMGGTTVHRERGSLKQVPSTARRMTKAHMAVARQPDRIPDQSPLARARLQRRLTVEAAAQRAGLSPDQVDWLEDGRVYRFATTDDALVAALLYASALGIDQREARALAGLQATPLIGGSPRSRLVGIAALLAALAALGGVFWLQNREEPRGSST